MVAVDKLLDSGRRGRAALVLEGNPGIGKTTVWRQGISRAADAQYRVLTCRTAPTEARLSFTALSDLLAPLEFAAFASLPDPQRRALDAALLRAQAEGAANPRAIGTAVVSLLSRLAASGPVLLAIDDLQWLDVPSARALEFALRRLDAQPIAVLATARLGERGGVPRLVRAEPGATRDETVVVSDPVFNIQGVNTRRAEPRNTPTMINAALTLENFWDRRAANVFNGVSVQGVGDSAARVLRADDAGRITPVIVRIDNASLASQAVGPPLSDREMGSLGRTFKDVGKRLASARPLRRQRVADDDSVLAPYVDDDGERGLDTTYRQLIEKAFQPAWWRSNLIVRVGSNGALAFVPRPNRALRDNEYTMLEYNFSLFFGLSVQLYEMTLISDDAPIDRFFAGRQDALTEKERRGMGIFNSETADTACFGCHSGAEFTDNSRRIIEGAVVDGVRQPSEWVERMFNGECEPVAYDQGIYNIGVRPTEEDLGGGSNDPFGNPLSFVKLMTLPASEIASPELLTYPIPNIADPPIAIGERTVTDGTFKVPSLRNLQLTAPYFHNGGQRTIRQVVEFYNRGGDFREHNVENIDFEIGKLNLYPEQIDDLVAFLGRPLTDLRVVRQSAPFDHPQLFVPNGHLTMRDGTSAGRP